MWTIVDNNGTGNVFTINHAQGYESPTAIGVSYIGKDVDASLYSAPVRLEKGKTYRFTTKVISTSFQSFSLHVTYGKDTTLNAQRNEIENLVYIEGFHSVFYNHRLHWNATLQRFQQLRVV